MPVVTAILEILLVLVSILLVGIILLQRTKGSGAGVSFGGMGEAIFGADVGNVLTRSTIVLGSAFLAITILLSVITSRSGKKAIGSVVDRHMPAPAAVQEAALPELPAGTAAPSGDEAASADSADEAAPAGEAAAEAADAPVAEGEAPAEAK